MSLGSTDSLERMTQAELIDLVRRLIGEMAGLQAELERRDGAEAGQRAEIQTLKDEIKRLKGLPPRPPYKPSGMEKATDRRGRGDEAAARPRRVQTFGCPDGNAGARGAGRLALQGL